MKKVYSLLALPLVATTLLFGCGKTDRNVEELTTLHANIVSKYTTSDGFYTTTNNSEDAFYVVYNNDANLNDKVLSKTASSSLDTRYSQLSTVYARTMTLAYSYYQNFKDVFYNNIADRDYEKDELSELYDRLKAFQRELEDFDTAKKDLEREVKLFGVDGEVVGAKVDSFNNDYADLIETTLDFVNYFRDLHVKYFYPSNVDVDKSYAKRVYNDGLLTLANYLYYDYLVALEENGSINTTYLCNNSSNNIYNIYYNNNNSLNNLVVSGNKNTVQLNSTLLDKLDSTDETQKTKAQESVKQFEVSLNTFKQYFELYKEVYGKVSMSEHNNYRFKTNGGYGEDADALNNYLDSLSVVDAANVRVLIDIEESRVQDFVESFETLQKA